MTKAQIIIIGLLILLGIAFIGLGYYIESEVLLPPNVVFIVIDTLRADCINPSIKPNPITPFLSSIAEHSIYFSNAVTPCSWTKPTIATFLTGVSPEKHQVRYSIINEDPDNPSSDVLSENYLTLPEYLVQKGYETYAVQTNGNLVPLLGFAQGFKPENFYFSYGATAETVTKKAMEFLVKVKRPFFLYLHYLDPHAPYSPPAEVLKNLPDAQSLSEEEKEWISPENYMKYLMDLVRYRTNVKTSPPDFEYSEAGKRELQRLYYGEVLYADTEVKKVVEFISRNYPKTIFVIISDHGEEFWEHNGVGHGTTLYDEQVRVPVIIYGWHITPKRIDKPVPTGGISSTILNLLNIPIPAQFEEPDLLSLAEEDNPSSYMVTWGPWKELNIELKGVLKYPWKLIENIHKGEVELYNLKEDTKEIINITQTNQTIVESLLSEMKYYKTKTDYTETNTMELSPDIKNQLESLGYLGGN